MFLKARNTFTFQYYFLSNAQNLVSVLLAGVKSAIDEGLRTFRKGSSPQPRHT
jgi:hypothetical protein